MLNRMCELIGFILIGLLWLVLLIIMLDLIMYFYFTIYFGLVIIY